MSQCAQDERRQRPPVLPMANHAVAWSFFIPPVGLVLGLIAWLRIRRDRERYRGEAVALSAVANGIVAPILIWGALRLLVKVIRWAHDMGTWPYDWVP